MSKIIIKNLTKKFNNKIVVNNLVLEIKSGELFAYIGPNGAGKTTTIRILLQIIKPTKGKIKMIGNNDNFLPKEKIGFVLEEETPFGNFTPEEYLQFYAEIYKVKEKKQKIQELLKKFSLYTMKKQKVSKFSKGMKRKLCVAKALIGNPEVLFLDEPLEGIEIEARKEIKDILLEMKKDKIIFLTSHNLYEIEPLCNSFGIIIDGVFMGKWLQESLDGKSLEEFYFRIKEKYKNENSY